MKSYLAFLLPCLLLSACGEGQNARDLLGLSRNAPDEFKVVSRPPLSVPPDFALRPPAEGADTTNLPPSDLAARAMLTGNDEESLSGEKQTMGDAETAVGVVESFDLESEADEGFLANIGAGDAKENIRETLDQEQASREAAIQKELDSAFGWVAKPKDEDSTIVNAEEEKKRLKANKDSGKSVTEGETPSIEPKAKGPLEGIF